MPEVQNLFRSRLAPTPSGYLHEGNAFNFLLTWLFVRKNGGVLRLRIDDYDLPRVRDEYLADIFHLLDWLGIDWDEGPQSPDDHKRNFSSIHRIDLYSNLLSDLRTSGQTYSCICSKKDLLKRACTCWEKRVAGAEAVAQRIHVPAGTEADFTDVFSGEIQVPVVDFTIWRKDNLPSYQLASLADDVHFNTSFIIRGNDLLDSTAAQIYLAKTASIPSFPNIRFAHHPLLADFNGEKLSKSAGSVAMKNHYQNRQQREEFFRRFCKWAGLRDVATSPQELLKPFKLEKIIFSAGPITQ